MECELAEPSTGSRGRGRPKGTGYPDGPAVEAMRAMLHPILTVASVRAAARAVAPRAHRWGNAAPLRPTSGSRWLTANVTPPELF